MKKFIFSIVMCLMAVVASGQTMKVVVDSSGEVVGRWIATKATTYTISIQDQTEVPRQGLKVVTYSAARGQGIVYRNIKRTGNIRVRKSPSTSSAIVALIPDSYEPFLTFPCLGYKNNWYKIKINGKVGYVRGDMVNWDAIDTY